MIHLNTLLTNESSISDFNWISSNVMYLLSTPLKHIYSKRLLFFFSHYGLYSENLKWLPKLFPSYVWCAFERLKRPSSDCVMLGLQTHFELALLLSDWITCRLMSDLFSQALSREQKRLGGWRSKEVWRVLGLVCYCKGLNDIVIPLACSVLLFYMHTGIGN